MKKRRTKEVSLLATVPNIEVCWTSHKGELCLDLISFFKNGDDEKRPIGRIPLMALSKEGRIKSNHQLLKQRIEDSPTRQEAILQMEELLLGTNIVLK